jgi:hypothetical protein
MDQSTAALASAIAALVKQDRQSRRWTLGCAIGPPVGVRIRVVRSWGAGASLR